VVIVAAPAVAMSLRELAVPRPLATRRPLPLAARPTTFPNFSLVLEASDLESSGAVRGLEEGMSQSWTDYW
jgi:hypothetical protein